MCGSSDHTVPPLGLPPEAPAPSSMRAPAPIPHPMSTRLPLFRPPASSFPHSDSAPVGRPRLAGARGLVCAAWQCRLARIISPTVRRCASVVLPDRFAGVWISPALPLLLIAHSKPSGQAGRNPLFYACHANGGMGRRRLSWWRRFRWWCTSSACRRSRSASQCISTTPTR